MTAAPPSPNRKKIDCWTLANVVLAQSPRVLLHGPPGAGKTYAATRFGLRPGQPVASCTLTPETPAAELPGFYVPRGNEFVWQDGPARRVSFRTWSEYAKLRALVGSDVAARAVFGNRSDDVINAFLIGKA